MTRRRHTAEEIILEVREAEVGLSQGKAVSHVCKQLEVTEQTYYCWRKEYGGLRVDQAKRLRELERENTRLKRLVADQSPPRTRHRPAPPIQPARAPPQLRLAF